jgi:hypothetical protein
MREVGEIIVVMVAMVLCALVYEHVAPAPSSDCRVDASLASK